MRNRSFFALITIPILLACTSGTQSLPRPDTPYSDVGPTRTILPVLSASELVSTPTSSASVAPSTNIGTPIPRLEEIPVMPGAINGEFIDGSTYSYSINAAVGDADTYYVESLMSMGWSLSNRQVMEISMFTGPATILEFQRNGQSIYIMLSHFAEDNSTGVFMSHSNPLEP
jgi:hypothetical protein